MSTASKSIRCLPGVPWLTIATVWSPADIPMANTTTRFVFVAANVSTFMNHFPSDPDGRDPAAGSLRHESRAT